MQWDNAMTVDAHSWPEAESYFRFYAEGRRDHFARNVFIYNVDEVRESRDGQRLYFGRAGTDGIEFVYRRGSPEIWAYYPIEGDHDLKATDIENFEQAWKAGAIKV